MRGHKKIMIWFTLLPLKSFWSYILFSNFKSINLTLKFDKIFHYNDHFFLKPWFLLPDILILNIFNTLYKSLKFSLIKDGGIFKDQFKLISIQNQLISSFNIVITKLPFFNQTKTFWMKWLAKATFAQIIKTFVRLSWVMIAKCFFICELLTARTDSSCVKIIWQKEEEEVTRNAGGWRWIIKLLKRLRKLNVENYGL